MTTNTIVIFAKIRKNTVSNVNTIQLTVNRLRIKTSSARAKRNGGAKNAKTVYATTTEVVNIATIHVGFTMNIIKVFVYVHSISSGNFAIKIALKRVKMDIAQILMGMINASVIKMG
jgi:hypothetical protein